MARYSIPMVTSTREPGRTTINQALALSRISRAASTRLPSSKTISKARPGAATLTLMEIIIRANSLTVISLDRASTLIRMAISIVVSSKAMSAKARGACGTEMGIPTLAIISRMKDLAMASPPACKVRPATKAPGRMVKKTVSGN